MSSIDIAFAAALAPLLTELATVRRELGEVRQELAGLRERLVTPPSAPSADERVYLTVGEAAARCRVHPRTIARRIDDGTLAVARLGRRVRIAVVDLDRAFAASAAQGSPGILPARRPPSLHLVGGEKPP